MNSHISEPLIKAVIDEYTVQSETQQSDDVDCQYHAEEKHHQNCDCHFKRFRGGAGSKLDYEENSQSGDSGTEEHS